LGVLAGIKVLVIIGALIYFKHPEQTLQHLPEFGVGIRGEVIEPVEAVRGHGVRFGIALVQ
jgi:hypothetical protein